MNTENTKQRLLAVYDEMERTLRQGWCQYVDARLPDGSGTRWDDPAAVEHCLCSAGRLASRDSGLPEEELNKIKGTLTEASVAYVKHPDAGPASANDALGSKLSDVLDVVATARRLAEKRLETVSPSATA